MVSPKLRSTDFYFIFREILFYFHNNNITHLYLKEIPFFYNEFPNDEWKHLAFVAKATLYRRDLCSVINLKKEFSISRSIVRDAKSGRKTIDSFCETTDYELFWNEILIPEMQQKYQTKPVHSLEEMVNLAEKFPHNIKLYAAYKENRMIAGTVLFISNDVVHAQYISGLRTYRKSGVLDFIFHELITNVFKDFAYFDFGISNEDHGKKTNKGLLFWKEGFGARGSSQDFYKFATQNYSLIDQMYL